MTTTAGRTVWTIRQGRTWRKAYQWVRNGVAVAELANATDIVAEIRTGTVDEGGVLIQRLSLSGGEISLTGTVQAATPVTTAFSADGTIIASGADFLDDKGSPNLRIRRTLEDGAIAPGDAVTLAGTTSNDGTYEALEVVSDTQIRVGTPGTFTEAVFVAEPAVGTVQVDRDGEFVLLLTDVQTDALTIPTNKRGIGEVYLDFPSDVVPFIDAQHVRFILKAAA